MDEDALAGRQAMRKDSIFFRRHTASRSWAARSSTADDGREPRHAFLAQRCQKLVAVGVRLGEDDGAVAALEGECEAGRVGDALTRRREVRPVGHVTHGERAEIFQAHRHLGLAHPVAQDVDGAAADVGAGEPMPGAEPGAPPQGRLEVAAHGLGRGLLERHRLVVDQARHPVRRPWRVQALDRRAAGREVVAPHRHAVGLRVRRRVDVVRRALPGRCVDRAIDAVLLDQHAADAGAARRGHEAAQLGMMDAYKHLHGRSTGCGLSRSINGAYRRTASAR